MSVISIDFCGTLDKYAPFWKEMLGYLRQEGIEVYIISGIWPNDLESRLADLGFNRRTHYDGSYSIFGHLSREGISVWFDENQDAWKAEPAIWWNTKAAICEKIHSWIHFDNDMRFKSAFSNIATRFVHLDSDTGKSEIKKWHEQLKLANVYDDWEDDYMFMSGIVPT